MAESTPRELPKLPRLHDLFHRNLIFVSGKGGVGKTVVSQAAALVLASQGRKTLWIGIEDPTRPPGELRQIRTNLWHLNCEASLAFEEYASLKIGSSTLTRVFVRNKLVQYLSKAAPGIHELVLLGKIWFEREHYDHVIVDMPSTGYGLAMFQSTENFSRLFAGGPLHRDADAMLATFRDASLTGHLIVSLPEEMPLQESIELGELLIRLFPRNPPLYLVNRCFPAIGAVDPSELERPGDWKMPLARDARDFAEKRSALEEFNLRLWRNRAIEFAKLSYVPPAIEDIPAMIEEHLADEMKEKGYL